MPTFNNICVIGGMESKGDTRFQPVAIDLGKAIADRKITLVYGGGIRGLQGRVAVSAMKKGGKVLSISLKNRNTFHITHGVEVKAQLVYDKFDAMFIHANAFIALPSGLETLEHIITFTF